MGKASRKKRQQESQPESILNGKSLISNDISSKWSLFNKPLIHFFLIAIIGFLVYSNTFHVPFHFDDTNNIVENYKLRNLNNFWPPSGSRWFGFLTFALNYYFGGLNTIGYHAVNLAIHILNAIFVYWLVSLTLKALKYQRVKVSEYQSLKNSDPMTLGRFDTSIALFSSLLFVSHPIQTQAVTYIVQRFTSLATMFYLLSLVMYIKFRSQQSAISDQQKLHATRYTLYAVSLISAVLAMKTKEISFTLPIIIVLYEFMFFEGKFKKRILYLLPLLLTMLIIPLSMIGIDKPVGDAIGELREAAQETDEIPRWSYLFTQFRVIVTYIRLLVLPINQNLDYDYPIYHSFFNPEVFLSFLFLLLIFVFGIYLLHSKRYTLSASRFLAFGIFWFFITLSVESSIIPIRDVIFEHRLYLPFAGIALIMSAVSLTVFKAKADRIISRKIVISIFILIILIFSGVTHARNIVWQQRTNLWKDVVEKSPGKARPYNNLCNQYNKIGAFDKAIDPCQTAIRLNFNYPEAHNNLGVAYREKGLIDDALNEFSIAKKQSRDYADVHVNIANIYTDEGLFEEAKSEFNIALKINPFHAKAHNNLGVVYKKQGLLDEAIKQYQEAISIDSNYADAYNNLGLIYHEKGLLEKSITVYRVALKLKPSPEIHYNLAMVLEQMGENLEAIEHYEQFIQFAPPKYSPYIDKAKQTIKKLQSL